MYFQLPKIALYYCQKQLADVAKDIDKLTEEDKKFVIERVDKLNPIGLVELDNTLDEDRYLYEG